MLTKNITRQAKSLVAVQITMPWEDLQPKWDEVVKNLASELELPGFRKGQAPIALAEQNLGKKIIDEVIRVVMPQAVIEALQGTDIVPIDYPKYQQISINKGTPLSFTAIVTERPKVSVGDYKNLSVLKPALKTVTDADVSKIIDDLYKRWKAKNSLQTTANSNQTVNQAADNGNGSISFDAPLASQTSEGPDDNFAKAVGGESLADLKNKIKTDLEAEAKFNNELDYEEAILQEVEKITSVEVPDVLVEDELNRMMVNLQRRVADMGLLLEDYLKGQNETIEGLKAKWRAQAEKNVRMELGLAEIGKQEKIQISDEDLQAEINKIQDAKLKAQFEAEEPRLHLKHSLRQVKTLNLLKGLVKA